MLAVLVIFVLVGGGLLATPQAGAVGAANPVRISQVYGGGGNTGALYRNDFIEIFNAGTTAVDISNWSVQYASATGTSWSIIPLNGILQPGQYYLVQGASGGSVGALLPSPDATGTINLSASAGKVALVGNNDFLTGSCPTAGIVDLVGFGTTANCSEGSRAPAGSNTTAVIRANNGCQDIDNNGADFSAASPTPRNTASPVNLCAANLAVTGTVPADGAVDISPEQNITVHFSEPATILQDDFYDIQCLLSGAHNSGMSDTTANPFIVIDPDVNFSFGETCTVTLDKTKIADADGSLLGLADDYTFSFSILTPGSCTSAYFSEYVEGSGNNKALEIFNGTGVALDLTGWSVKGYFNASTAATHIASLDGTIAQNDVLVICNNNTMNSPELLSRCDIKLDSVTFNGNDTVVLLDENLHVVDSIGKIAENPSIEWGSGLTSTADNTLRRKAGILMGDIDPNDSFDPAVDWDGFVTDTFDGLGSHSSYCGIVDLRPGVYSTSPANLDTVLPTATISVQFTENVQTNAGWYDLQCPAGTSVAANVSGSGDNRLITPTYDLPDYTTCQLTIVAANVSDLDAAMETMAEDYVVSFQVNSTVDFCPGAFTPISAIQGSGSASPVSGTVTTRGIVTADLQADPGMDGFYLQSLPGDVDADPLTSEGLMIYSSSLPASVGDVVRVQGSVVEYNGLTELSNPTLLETCGTGYPIPAPVVLDLPDSANSAFSLEPYEGMLVTIPETLTVQQNYFQGRYGEITLGAGGRIANMHNFSKGGGSPYEYTRMIILDDARSSQNQNPIAFYASDGALRAGDTVSGLTGILDEGLINSTSGAVFPYRYYRLQPSLAPAFSQTNLRPAGPPEVGGTLKIVGANVYNYFVTLDNGSYPSGSPYGGSDTPRGADTEEEFTRQQNKLVAELAALDADVIGLMEIESWDGAAAPAALVNALNAQAGAGTYAYVADAAGGFFDPAAGGDFIQVALIYQPARVTLVGGAVSTNDTTFSRSPFAQEFEENLTGEQFVVVVNHFKSKGCDGATGLNADQGDGQGCWNALRREQAAALLTFINNSLIPLDADVLVIGDLNAYGAEDPIGDLTTGGLVNQAAAFVPAAERYSYVFDGAAGYLDHALGTASTSALISDVAFWHINADEPAIIGYDTEFKTPWVDSGSPDLYAVHPYRSSDHDPVVIGFGNYDFSDLGGGYPLAYQVIGGSDLRLGSINDADSAFSEGTDNDADDGVEFMGGTWEPGGRVTLQVTVSGGVDGQRSLAIWMDWNGLNGFGDPGEAVFFENVAVGVQEVQIDIPMDAGYVKARDLNARFRLYASAKENVLVEAAQTQGNQMMASSPGGRALGGEIEDYHFYFSPTAIELIDFSAGSRGYDGLIWFIPGSVSIMLLLFAIRQRHA